MRRGVSSARLQSGYGTPRELTHLLSGLLGNGLRTFIQDTRRIFQGVKWR
jgi:hypothetical protein